MAFTHIAFEIESDGCPVGHMFRTRQEAEEWASGQRARGTRHQVTTVGEYFKVVVARWKKGWWS